MSIRVEMNYLRQVNRIWPSTSPLFNTVLRRKMGAVKPPNIFIYDGLEKENESYANLKSAIQSCLDVNSYIVYHLSVNDLDSKPWSEHTKLLVITAQTLPEASVQSRILEYLRNSGSLLALHSGIDQLFVKNREHNFDQISLCNGQTLSVGGSSAYEISEGFVSLANVADKLPVIVKSDSCRDTAGIVVCTRIGQNYVDAILPYLLPEFGLEMKKSENVPELTHLYVFSSDGSERFLDGICSILRKEITRNGTSLRLVHTNIRNQAFDIAKYWSCLHTRKLGRILVFAEVIGSTNDILEGLMGHVPGDCGLVAIALCQTKGRGRSGNAWLSPKGTACFSFLVSVPIFSTIGKAIPFVQQIAALAIVTSVWKLTDHGVELKVKWPNDVYSQDGRKLAGILTKSSIFHGEIAVVIGCGVNVSNEKTSVCINELICEGGQKIGVEDLVATCLSEFERLVAVFEANRAQFLDIFYANWLHSGQRVTLRLDDGGQESAEVVGVDESGYLRVRNIAGQLRSVHPDGNSFDMMHGLIYGKS